MVRTPDPECERCRETPVNYVLNPGTTLSSTNVLSHEIGNLRTLSGAIWRSGLCRWVGSPSSTPVLPVGLVRWRYSDTTLVPGDDHHRTADLESDLCPCVDLVLINIGGRRHGGSKEYSPNGHYAAVTETWCAQRTPTESQEATVPKHPKRSRIAVGIIGTTTTVALLVGCSSSSHSAASTTSLTAAANSATVAAAVNNSSASTGSSQSAQSSAGSGSSKSTINVCGLVPLAAVSAASGLDLSSGAPDAATGVAGVSGCKYVSNGTSTADIVSQLDVQIDTVGGGFTLQGLKAGLDSAASAAAPTVAVSGLGEGAFSGSAGTIAQTGTTWSTCQASASIYSVPTPRARPSQKYLSPPSAEGLLPITSLLDRGHRRPARGRQAN